MTLMAGGRLRWMVALVMSATVIGLLGLAALPSDARDGVADNRARFSACVGAAKESYGFVDVRDHFGEKAANCLAYYGITAGTTPDTFSPDALITRSQLAVFLTKAAGPAGVRLEAASDLGFEDLGGLSNTARDAINRMIAAKIMDSSSRAAFEPWGNVTRREMAVYLEAFLEEAVIGPGGTRVSALDADDKVFNDIRYLPRYVREAIWNLYELGITAGRTASTFGPDVDVTRAQMAVFVTSLLAHTNARPEGVSIQADLRDAYRGGDIELSVSVRDRLHRPVEDEYVDVFRATDEARAFNASGLCTRYAHRLDGSEACTIDRRDETTDRDGNLELTLEHTGKEMVVFAWTGDRGDDFRFDRAEAAELYLDVVKPVAGVEVTDDMQPGAEYVRLGDSVTFTLQLIDEDGEPVDLDGWEVRIFSLEVDGNRKRTRTRDAYATDASGRIELTYLQEDVDPGRGDTPSLDFDVSRLNLDTVEDKTTLQVVRYDFSEDDQPVRDVRVMWSDERAEAANLVLYQDEDYHEASDRGDGVDNTVWATLTDQYGEGIQGVRILFFSDDTYGLRDRSASRTNSRGVASVTYERDNDRDRVERIWARTDDREIDLRTHRDLRHYWGVWVDDDTDISGGGEVKAVDIGEETAVVIDGGEVLIITWDSNDRFCYDGDGVDIEEFERLLKVNNILAYRYYDDSSVERFNAHSPGVSARCPVLS